MLLKNAVILINFIINISTIISLSIPFYSYKNLDNATTITEILDFMKNNDLYTYIFIGEPSQKLPIIITTYDSLIVFKKDNCPFEFIYDINLSKSSLRIYDNNNTKYYYINDYISFDKEKKHINMTFILINMTLFGQNMCGFFGMQYIPKDIRDNTNNLILDLKNKNIIKKSIFFFNYTSDNNGILNIGVEPFETNPQLFSQNNMQIIDVDYILDYEIKREYRGKFRWNLNISKVFYFKKLPIQSELDPYVEISRKKRR